MVASDRASISTAVGISSVAVVVVMGQGRSRLSNEVYSGDFAIGTKEFLEMRFGDARVEIRYVEGIGCATRMFTFTITWGGFGCSARSEVGFLVCG